MKKKWENKDYLIYSAVLSDLYNKIIFLLNSTSLFSINVILYVQSTRLNYVERMWTNLVQKNYFDVDITETVTESMLCMGLKIRVKCWN